VKVVKSEKPALVDVVVQNAPTPRLSGAG